MKIFKDNQDVLTFIMLIIWFAMDVFLWFKLGSEYALACNLCWIFIFCILTLLKDFNKKFHNWLYTPLKKKEGK